MLEIFQPKQAKIFNSVEFFLKNMPPHWVSIWIFKTLKESYLIFQAATPHQKVACYSLRMEAGLLDALH
ncbi:hypothetical protein ES703_18370 [subsurface metagenome]